MQLKTSNSNAKTENSQPIRGNSFNQQYALYRALRSNKTQIFVESVAFKGDRPHQWAIRILAGVRSLELTSI